EVPVTDSLAGPTPIFAELQRLREFIIRNDALTLSPFVAFLATPFDRFFTQGFVQFDLPVSDNRYSYSSTFPGFAGRSPTVLRLNPVFEAGHIREQTLLHVDVGTGYWLLRDPQARWLAGLAPTVGLHYTTSLDDAHIITQSH